MRIVKQEEQVLDQDVKEAYLDFVKEDGLTFYETVDVLAGVFNLAVDEVKGILNSQGITEATKKGVSDKSDDEKGKEKKDGTGPHGKGDGPGKGKADGSGMKDDAKDDEDEDNKDDKKVDKKKKESTILTIEEEVQVGDIILEVGDKIEVLKEDIQDEIGDVQQYLFQVKEFIDEVDTLFEGLESIITDPESRDFFDKLDIKAFNNAQVLLPELLKVFGLR